VLSPQQGRPHRPGGDRPGSKHGSMTFHRYRLVGHPGRSPSRILLGRPVDPSRLTGHLQQISPTIHIPVKVPIASIPLIAIGAITRSCSRRGATKRTSLAPWKRYERQRAGCRPACTDARG
jgi:hypothetical protein